MDSTLSVEHKKFDFLESEGAFFFVVVEIFQFGGRLFFFPFDVILVHSFLCFNTNFNANSKLFILVVLTKLQASLFKIYIKRRESEY